jgi:hypothetical protein
MIFQIVEDDKVAAGCHKASGTVREGHCTGRVFSLRRWGLEWWEVASEGRDKNSCGVVIDLNNRRLISESNRTE